MEDNRLHCKEDPIYVFLEMKLSSLVPNSHIHVSVSDFRGRAVSFLEIFVWNFWYSALAFSSGSARMVHYSELSSATP